MEEGGRIEGAESGGRGVGAENKLTLAPPAHEAGQEQRDGVPQESGQREQQPEVVRHSTDTDSDDFIRSHVLVVRPGISDIQRQSGKNIKL